jgi:hypothetical protein
VTGLSSQTFPYFQYGTIAYNAAIGAQSWVRLYYGSSDGQSDAHSVAVSPADGKVFVTGSSSGHHQPRLRYQRSASGSRVELVKCSPTAVHEVADVHDTARSRRLSPVSAGLGVGWIFQLLPFHRSANTLYPEELV